MKDFLGAVWCRIRLWPHDDPLRERRNSAGSTKTIAYMRCAATPFLEQLWYIGRAQGRWN